MTDNPWRPDDEKHNEWRSDLNHYSNRQSSHRKTRKKPHYVRFVFFLFSIIILFGGLAIVYPANSINYAYLIQGLIILVVFGGAAVLWSKSSLKRLTQIIGLWAIIIGVISLVYLYKTDINARFMSAIDPSGVSTTDDGLIVHRSKDGHFWLRAYANDIPIRMMVDTGASNIVLSPEDASRIGLNLDNLNFSGVADTANGQVTYARTKIKHMNFGDAQFNDVPVTINGSEMKGSLLGLSILNEFSSIEFRGDMLILRP